MVGTGAALTGFASAQAPAPVVTVIPPAMQQPITANGGNSANSNNNYQAQMLPGNVANPTPGTFVVRLNGQLWSEFFLGGGSGFVGSGPQFVDSGGLGPGPGRPGTAVFLGTGTNAGQKLAPYSIGTYFRLYPGVDAMATNGLRYGAQTEIRENFIAAQSNTGNTGTSGLTSGQTLYVRRAFWYVAGDNWGLIRMGQSDGVTGIFDNGITTGQQPGQGLWNGDAPGIVAGNGPTYPWFTQQGAEYGSPKVVYLSPQLYGFDFGFDYAPNNGNQEFAGGPAGAGIPNLSSTITPPGGARFRDLYVGGARYQGTFGPVALYAWGAYLGSGHVQYQGDPTGLLARTLEGGPSLAQGSQYNGQFENISAGFAGVAVTYAGFTVNAAWQGGQYNGVMALKPQNGVGAQAWVAGIYYSNGPLGVGATYYQFDSQGAIGLTGLSQRHEDAFGVGGSYAIAPGLLGYSELLYFQRHQAGFDLNNGKYFNQAGYAGNNDVHGTAFVVGARMRW
jgi:Gram-negative porin